MADIYKIECTSVKSAEIVAALCDDNAVVEGKAVVTSSKLPELAIILIYKATDKLSQVDIDLYLEANREFNL